MQTTPVSYSRTKTACYLGFVTQAICANFVRKVVKPMRTAA